jgi:hypothetical protein
MKWQDIGRKLMGLAPAVGTALGGPMGGMIGSELARRLNVAPTPLAVNEAIAANPDLEKVLHEMQMEDTRIYMEATDSARVAFKDSPMPAVVFGVTSFMVAALGVVAVIYGKTMGPDAWEYLKFLGPQIFIVWTAAAGFYVNSSLGSKNKDRTIAGEMRR